MKTPFATLCCTLWLAAMPAHAELPAGTDCTRAVPVQVANKTYQTPRASQSGERWALDRQFEHVVIIVLENQDFATVMQHPYFQALAARGSLLTRFTGGFHPSYPNYLAMVGGGYFGTEGGTQRDLPPERRTIADLLEAKGLSWRQFAEGFPGDCRADGGLSNARYVRRHVPFASFRSVTDNPARCGKVVAATQFDRKALPNYAFYSPDLCNGGHDVCVKGSTALGSMSAWFLSGAGASRAKLDQAAQWLAGFLDPLLADPDVVRDTLIVVTFDESDDHRHNHIYTVLLGGMVKPGARIDACYDHYNVLRTVEDNFGIGTLNGEDEKSAPIADAFTASMPSAAAAAGSRSAAGKQ